MVHITIDDYTIIESFASSISLHEILLDSTYANLTSSSNPPNVNPSAQKYKDGDINYSTVGSNSHNTLPDLKTEAHQGGTVINIEQDSNVEAKNTESFPVAVDSIINNALKGLKKLKSNNSMEIRRHPRIQSAEQSFTEDRNMGKLNENKKPFGSLKISILPSNTNQQINSLSEQSEQLLKILNLTELDESQGIELEQKYFITQFSMSERFAPYNMDRHRKFVYK